MFLLLSFFGEVYSFFFFFIEKQIKFYVTWKLPDFMVLNWLTDKYNPLGNLFKIDQVAWICLQLGSAIQLLLFQQKSVVTPNFFLGVYDF